MGQMINQRGLLTGQKMKQPPFLEQATGIEPA